MAKESNDTVYIVIEENPVGTAALAGPFDTPEEANDDRVKEVILKANQTEDLPFMTLMERIGVAEASRAEVESFIADGKIFRYNCLLNKELGMDLPMRDDLDYRQEPCSWADLEKIRAEEEEGMPSDEEDEDNPEL